MSKLEHYPLPAVASSVCCALSVSGDRLLQEHRFFGSSGELIAVIFCWPTGPSKARGTAQLRWPSRPWRQAPCRPKPSSRRLRSWRSSDTTSWCLCTPWCPRSPSTSSRNTWPKVREMDLFSVLSLSTQIFPFEFIKCLWGCRLYQVSTAMWLNSRLSVTWEGQAIN